MKRGEKQGWQPLRHVARLTAFVGKYRRASRAMDYAEQRRAPGTNFARFGRQLGMRLLRSGTTLGVPSLLVAPVSITRYFEFDFVFAHIPPGSIACLDVSSPRLFSLFLATARRDASIHMINPDTLDAEITRRIADRLGYSNVVVSSDAVSELAGRSASYDCIWSISVIEHVAGDDGDTEAMLLMYRALRPGGRLIVTVPVDRRFWHEYRNQDYYGIQEVPSSSGEYFFQRLYDEAHLRARLIEPVGREPTTLVWFGEKVAGTFQAYERQWIELGPDQTIDDPRRIANDYTHYERWADMPGFGVCAMVIDKPQNVDPSPAP